MMRFFLKSQVDSLQISVAVTLPKSQPLAVIQLLHGVCGCKERYFPLMDFLTEKGYVCVINDHRGHGESIRERNDLGYFHKDGADALVEDVRMISEWAKDKYPDLPLYMIAHSMGSMVARVFLKKYDHMLDGIVLCGSPSRNPLSSAGRLFLSFLCFFDGGRSRPGFIQRMMSDTYNRKFHSEGPNAWTCSDPLMRKSFEDNPSCNFQLTSNGAETVLDLMNQTYSSEGWGLSNPRLPILFLSGEEDPCIISLQSFFKAVGHMRSVGYTNISATVYPEMRHEVLNEKDRIKVWNDILSFIMSSASWNR